MVGGDKPDASRAGLTKPTMHMNQFSFGKPGRGLVAGLILLAGGATWLVAEAKHDAKAPVEMKVDRRMARILR